MRFTVVPARLRTQRLHRWARRRACPVLDTGAAFFWLLFFAVHCAAGAARAAKPTRRAERMDARSKEK